MNTQLLIKEAKRLRNAMYIFGVLLLPIGFGFIFLMWGFDLKKAIVEAEREANEA